MLYKEISLTILNMHIAKKNMVFRYALLHMFFLFSLAVATPPNATKPGCQSRCGNVEIPYPFGIGPSCSMNKSFNINCSTSSNPPKPYLSFVDVIFDEVHNVEVVNISKFQIYVKNSEIQLTSKCYGMWSNNSTTNNSIYLDFSSTPYTLSDANKLTAVGCDDLALVQQPSNKNLIIGGIGCLPYCPSYLNDSISVGTCPDVGCCQISIYNSDFLYVYQDDVHTIWRREKKNFPCSFAFIGMIGDFGNFTYKLSDLNDPKAFVKNNKEFIDKPLVLDWRMGPHSNCTKTSCGNNSLCTNWDPHYGGYHCTCEGGYEGNPYLGCQDLDECNNNPCAFNGICNNTLGSYECYCHDGYYGDGKKKGIGCIRVPVLPVSHRKVIIARSKRGAYCGGQSCTKVPQFEWKEKANYERSSHGVGEC